MKNLKKDLIAKIKKEHNWYILDGDEGVIIEIDGSHEFCSFESLSEKELEEILEIGTLCTYDEAYGYHSEKGSEISDGERINCENKQRLVYNEYSLAAVQEAEQFEKEYLIETNQYYDWTSRLSRDIESQLDEEIERQKEEYGRADVSYYDYMPSEEFEKEKEEAYNALSDEARDFLSY